MLFAFRNYTKQDLVLYSVFGFDQQQNFHLGEFIIDLSLLVPMTGEKQRQFLVLGGRD